MAGIRHRPFHLQGIRRSKQIILGEPKPLAFVVAALGGAFMANKEHLLEPLLLTLWHGARMPRVCPGSHTGGGRIQVGVRDGSLRDP